MSFKHCDRRYRVHNLSAYDDAEMHRMTAWKQNAFGALAVHDNYDNLFVQYNKASNA